jgi:hypothetical protein
MIERRSGRERRAFKSLIVNRANYNWHGANNVRRSERRAYVEPPITCVLPQPEQPPIREFAPRKQIRQTITQLIRDHLPDFCWMTAHEVLAVIQQLDDTVQSKNVHMALMKLARKGEIELRQCRQNMKRNGKRVVFEYKAISS